MNKSIRYLSAGVLMNVYVPVGIGGTIAQTPLFVATQVAPNVFFMLDDSGSMDWTILSKKYWHPRAYDPDAGDDLNNSADASGTGSIIGSGNMDSFGTVTP